jgi:hypothetical protein
MDDGLLITDYSPRVYAYFDGFEEFSVGAINPYFSIGDVGSCIANVEHLA